MRLLFFAFVVSFLLLGCTGGGKAKASDGVVGEKSDFKGSPEALEEYNALVNKVDSKEFKVTYDKQGIDDESSYTVTYYQKGLKSRWDSVSKKGKLSQYFLDGVGLKAVSCRGNSGASPSCETMVVSGEKEFKNLRKYEDFSHALRGVIVAADFVDSKKLLGIKAKCFSLKTVVKPYEYEGLSCRDPSTGLDLYSKFKLVLSNSKPVEDSPPVVTTATLLEAEVSEADLNPPQNA